jgi:hypothetical protein
MAGDLCLRCGNKVGRGYHYICEPCYKHSCTICEYYDEKDVEFCDECKNTRLCSGCKRVLKRSIIKTLDSKEEDYRLYYLNSINPYRYTCRKCNHCEKCDLVSCERCGHDGVCIVGLDFS